MEENDGEIREDKIIDLPNFCSYVRTEADVYLTEKECKNLKEEDILQLVSKSVLVKISTTEYKPFFDYLEEIMGEEKVRKYKVLRSDKEPKFSHMGVTFKI